MKTDSFTNNCCVKISDAILFLALLVFPVFAFGQINVSNAAPYNNAYYLINNVFAGGNVSISNVQTYGVVSQYGFFSGASVIGMDSGIILSTGRVGQLCNLASNCPGALTTPNPPGTATGVNFGPTWMGTSTNNNLLTVSNSVPGLLGMGTAANDINDAAVIWFDFVPTKDTMHFSFVFASNEWPTWPCSMFNDVFGFFVSGPGITGGFNAPIGYTSSENFALIPGTNIPITITSINGPGNQGSCPSLSPYSSYFVQNVPATTGMNASYTTKMDVEFVVQPCQTYNFAIAIGDGSDGVLNSYVLMEANSFTASGVSVQFNASYDFGGDSILYEGCGSVTMEVVRLDNIQNPDTIHFNISGNATNGIDYTYIPDSVIFNPGQDTFTHTFIVPNDFIVEGPETLMIAVTDTDIVACVGTNDTLVVVIHDPIPLTSDAWTDTVMCTANNVQLAANPLTGLPAYDFQWSTGDTTDTITLSPTPWTSTSYTVTITDACSIYTIIDTAHLIIDNPPTSIDAPGDTIDCEASGAPIIVNITDPMPGLSIQWSTGHLSPQFWAFNPYITTDYIVTVTQNCAGYYLVDTFTLVVDNPPFTVSSVDDTINCTDPGTTIWVDVTNTTPSFDYLWNNGVTDSFQVVNPSTTTVYSITVTDACGVNSVVDSVTVFVINDPVSVYVGNENIPCVGDTATLTAYASGGYPPYSYLWSNGDNDSVTQMTSNVPTTTVFVSVTDICGLDTVVQQADIILATYPDLVITPLQGDTFNCPGEIVTFGSIEVTGGSGDYVVSWDNWQTTNDFFWAVIDSTVKFTVEAADLCNLDSASSDVIFVVLEHDELKAILPPDTAVCKDDVVLLKASYKGGAGNYSYRWNTGSTQPEIWAQSNTPQTYTVTITDDCENKASDEVTIVVTQPTAEFDYFFYDSYHVGFDNLSEDAQYYIWSFVDGDTSTAENPLKIYTVSKDYNVLLIATDTTGCSDSAYHKISPPLVAFIPNAFTPNGDGLNDYFMIQGEGFRAGRGIKEFKISIFDRWGAEIYSSNSIDFKWDGTYNGKPAPIGVYVYKVFIEGYDRQKIEMNGTVTIITNNR